MDPVSLPVTLALSLSKDIIGLLTAIKNRPEELQMLFVEISDLEVVLAYVETSIKSALVSDLEGVSASVLSATLRRTHDKLTQLDHLLKCYSDSKDGSTVIFRAVDWPLRGKKSTAKVKEELQTLKWGLSTAIGALTSSTSQQILAKVDQVELQVSSLNTELSQAKALVALQDQQTYTTLESLARSHEATIDFYQSTLSRVTSEAAETSTTMFVRGQANSRLPATANATHISLQQRNLCVPSCLCLCHTWAHLRSPTFLAKLIGTLYLGYSGAPLTATKCADGCRVRATYAARLQYQPPPGWLNRITTLAVFSEYGQPSAGLHVALVRPHSFRVFALSEAGDAEGLDYLFRNKLASPFDVSEQTGDNPLHITADHGHFEASRLLLSWGADPHAFDTDHKNTPHTFAQRFILGSRTKTNSTDRQNFASLFSTSKAIYELPRLHEVVVELQHAELSLEAQAADFDVNVQDMEGNTALNWACLRGEAPKVRWLLAHGADPNVPNTNIGRTPLMAACTHVSVECITLLLQYGANPLAQNEWGLDALIYLVDEDRRPQPIDDIVAAATLLFAKGVDLNPRGRNETWCLARAARTQILEVMEMILDCGQPINRTNRFGLTTLLRCVDWVACRSAEFLLTRGAAYTGSVAQDSQGRTLLHHVAENPSFEMIDVMRRVKLTGLDPLIRDQDGKTAVQTFEKLPDLPEKLRLAFREWIVDLQREFDVFVSGVEKLYYDAGKEGVPDIEAALGDQYWDAVEKQ